MASNLITLHSEYIWCHLFSDGFFLFIQNSMPFSLSNDFDHASLSFAFFRILFRLLRSVMHRRIIRTCDIKYRQFYLEFTASLWRPSHRIWGARNRTGRNSAGFFCLEEYLRNDYVWKMPFRHRIENRKIVLLHFFAQKGFPGDNPFYVLRRKCESKWTQCQTNSSQAVIRYKLHFSRPYSYGLTSCRHF